jgi:lycopene beta-cyclase
VADVLIAGGGPAGWSLARACAEVGHRVTLVAPTRTWPATYGLWLEEAAFLPPGARWVPARPRGMTRDYAILDNESVQAAFTHPGIEVVKSRAAAMTATKLRLTTGEILRADMAFDATGTLARPPTAQRPEGVGRVEQTAYGVAVAAGDAPIGPGEAIFMDWRQPPGFAGGPATFLYAVPLPGGRVLLEETCLAGRPALGFGELRDRLHARFGPLDGRVERVRFPVDIPPPAMGARGAIPFGAAAGLVHPATGFSLGDTFRLAPMVAHTIGGGPRAVRRVLWPACARAVYRLRVRGLATLLSLHAAECEEFFRLFFGLPDHLQRAYLSGRADLTGTVAAMAAMFRAAPAHLRRKMINP